MMLPIPRIKIINVLVQTKMKTLPFNTFEKVFTIFEYLPLGNFWLVLDFKRPIFFGSLLPAVYRLKNAGVNYRGWLGRTENHIKMMEGSSDHCKSLRKRTGSSR